ncbi:SDR family oxidoreductase [Sutcliffiella rhizosphaerae]|uniref:Ketoacyl reductase n=1 Tax=Sutcliffiella rhizosphaerae TaxID=2880967 RepID=A0ABN8A7C6_9BACI|nr:SDR family oxidoreductase [Sutcliffiella rhizosphaerae]CAG9621005.1 Putative ketoacyl reductase [Sutcliffiella rhizosphaerae]
MIRKTVIITGASGGFGMVFTKLFLQAGYHVVATIRNEAKKQILLNELRDLDTKCLTIKLLDVSDTPSVNEFERFVHTLGSVDVLINNAGFAVAGFSEELTVDEYMLQFETNFFGVIRVTNTILPIMRKQNSGRIVNISSISGLIGFPGLSPYVSSKHALEGYTESLRLEMISFGVDVVLVEPGSFQTNIWSSGTYMSAQAGQDHSPYSKMFQKLSSRLNKDSHSYGNPQEVGKLVLEIATSTTTPSLRYKIGKGVRVTVFLKRLLPWRLWEKLVLTQLNK